MAQRLADLGYAVLLLKIYNRSGGYQPFDLDTVFTVPEERDRLMSLAGSVTKELATRDTGVMLQFLAAQPRSPTRRRVRRATASEVALRSMPPVASPTESARRPPSTVARSQAPRPTAPTCSRVR